MKEKRGSIDFVLFIAILMLLAVGLIMVFSASMVTAMQKYGSGYHYLIRQALFTGVGIVAMLFVANFDYRRLRNKKLIMILMGIITALLVVVLFTRGIKGATRWIGVGAFSIQPSEIAKIVIIIFFAYKLSRQGESIKSFFKGTIVNLCIVGIFAGLILAQPNMSTAAILCMTVFCMLIVAGCNKWHLWSIAGIGALGGGLLAFAEEYRRRRVLSFLNPWEDPLGSGYQAIQSLYALGAGGFFGMGLGQSRQKWMYIPEAQNDFIFAIIGEELGFIGVLFVIVLFGILTWRGFKIALNCKDKFGTLLATGITSCIAIQASVNMLVVSSSMPVTGVTLPLISYGGSSLVFTLISLGILLNISRYSKGNGVE